MGTNAIEQRIAQLAYDEMVENHRKIAYNPCLNTGVNISYNIELSNGSQSNVIQIGNAKENPFRCRSMMRKLLVNDTTCYVTECSFNGVYQAEMQPNMTFIAFSAFAYGIDALHLSQDIDLYPFYYDVTVNICNMTMEELEASKWNTAQSRDYLNTYCRLNTYIFTLLHEGYRFSL